MSRIWLMTTVIALALMGCQNAKEARADDVEFNLNEAFALAGGQDATIAGETLRIRFDEVLEDSRCPVRVTCVWSGQARIGVVAQDAEGTPKTLTFNTNPAPDQNAQTAQVGDYVITLLSLEQYQATVEVRKSAP
jgi:uncharacterized lipoprotein NlpE involved in copper resistance